MNINKIPKTTCENCGHSILPVRQFDCVICRKKICGKCRMTYSKHDNYDEYDRNLLSFCDNCYDAIKNTVNARDQLVTDFEDELEELEKLISETIRSLQ